MGCLHGRLLHVGANAAAFRLGLPPRRRVRRPSRPCGGEGVRPERPGNGGSPPPEIRRGGEGGPRGGGGGTKSPRGGRPPGDRRRPSKAGARTAGPQRS